MARRYVVLLAALVACGGDDEGATAAGSGGTGGGGMGGAPAMGTRVRFDVDADLTADFYAMPYPSDARLTAAGTPDVQAMPRSGGPIPETLVQPAMDRPGFPSTPVAFFAFDGPITAQDPLVAVPAEPTAELLLIDVDPGSPDRGKLFPLTAHTLPTDDYVPENFLSVGAFHGVSLPAGRSYAFVVRTSLGTDTGEALLQHESIAALIAGEDVGGAGSLFAPLWETLDTISIDASTVAGATVFTVGDVAGETLDMSETLLARYDLTIEGLALDPDDGATHDRFCELTGTIDYPRFNVGTPPYNDEGNFVIGSDGAPEEQTRVVANVTLTLPKSAMPDAGYPLVLYIHGSGGMASQVVDRGPVTEVDGPWAVGQGPAHVVAEHGFAAVGAAMPLNPVRVPGAGDFDYINPNNPGSFGYVFRQGVFEQRLLIEALENLTIDPAIIAGCTGPTLPVGATAYRYDVEPLMIMGQSMGGQYANLVAAIEPKITGIVPTGAGGYWGEFFKLSQLFGGVSTLIGALFGIETTAVDHLHPGLHLLQTAWEPGEPLAYIPHIAARPFAGQPSRAIYQPVASEDEFFPTLIFDAMALAFGTQQAGDEVWPSMQTSLALVGQDGLASYPLANNRTTIDGVPVTSVVVQYEPDAFLNGHYVFQQRDEMKYQYGCFFASLRTTGTATVPAPAALGTPCPM